MPIGGRSSRGSRGIKWGGSKGFSRNRTGCKRFGGLGRKCGIGGLSWRGFGHH